MRVPKLLRTTALVTSLIAASVPLSVPANAAWGGWHGGWGGWHGGGWGWGGVGLGLAAGALVGAALTAPYWGGYGYPAYGYGYPAYGYGYGYPAYGYGYGYPAYGYGYGPSYGSGYGYGPSYAVAPTMGAATRTRVAHPTTSNGNMYMRGDIHRASKVTGSALSTQKFQHNQNSYR